MNCRMLNRHNHRERLCLRRLHLGMRHRCRDNNRVAPLVHKRRPPLGVHQPQQPHETLYHLRRAGTQHVHSCNTHIQMPHMRLLTSPTAVVNARAVTWDNRGPKGRDTTTITVKEFSKALTAKMRPSDMLTPAT